jgi:Hemingway/CFA97
MKKILDEKLTARWFWSKSQSNHSKRLQDIKHKLSNRIDNSQPRTRSDHRPLKFLEVERKTEIHKENLKLLGVLADVSCGKRSTSIQIILDSVKALPKPKSLNLSYRKQEAKRIINENEAFAKRLMKNKHELSFKRLDKEWHNSVKYKKTISKAKFRLLPKIDSKPRTSDIEKSFSTRDNKKRAFSLMPDSVSSSENIKNTVKSPENKIINRELIQIQSWKSPPNFMVKGEQKNKLKDSNGPAALKKNSKNRKLEPITK